LASAGRCDAALLQAELAVPKHADVPEVQLDVGLVLATCDGIAEAREHLEAAVALRPNWHEAAKALSGFSERADLA